jgi:hypothetical protein
MGHGDQPRRAILLVFMEITALRNRLKLHNLNKLALRRTLVQWSWK